MKKKNQLTQENRIKGGNSVHSLYGKEHFSEMGKKSAKKRLSRAIKKKS